MLELHNIHIALGDLKIEIQQLKVEKGDYLAIMGPTGAGKTVLLESIAGLHALHGGKVMLNGRDITHMAPNKRGIAMVYQDYVLFPHLSVLDNIIYPLRIRKNRDFSFAMKLANMLEIEHLLDRKPNTLSGGEMQRVALARALVTRPNVVLLDEPFSSLDRKTKCKVRKIVKDTISELNATVIHITHDAETAWVMANKVAVMHKGKIVQVGSTEDIFTHPKTEFVANFVDTNILKGEVIDVQDSLTAVKVGNVKLYTAAPAKGNVVLSIRPENIIVSKAKIESSMRNELHGQIESMESTGSIVKLRIKIDDMALVSTLTPNAIHALSLEPNAEVFVYFKASSVHVL